MNRTFFRIALTLALAAPVYTHAQDLATPMASLANNGAAKIACHGSENVPMTTDSEQALPLQTIATLHCGDQISVLSDSEGYTAKVRTLDGRTGYVATVYVEKLAAGKATAPSVKPLSIKNGVARWQSNTQGCEQFSRGGVLVKSLTANGITVQATVLEDGANLRAVVAVSNHSAQYVYLNPVGITLEAEGAHWKLLPSVNTATPVFVNVNQSSPAKKSADVTPETPQPVTYKTNDKDSSLLKPGAVRPDETIAGTVWFQQSSTGSTELIMRVPVDNGVFEFPLSLNAAQ